MACTVVLWLDPGIRSSHKPQKIGFHMNVMRNCIYSNILNGFVMCQRWPRGAPLLAGTELDHNPLIVFRKNIVAPSSA